MISMISATPQALLFGIGWGGLVENPIYGATTRFTHSVLSFYLLKSGVLGLMGLGAIGAILLFEVRRRFGDRDTWTVSRKIVLVSCLPPLLIGVLFEPTYKILSYGVILALALLTIPRAYDVERR